MINRWLEKIGPGTLVAAAFIGPGTVTVCTIAGVSFGYSLLWALVLSVFMTYILQEMASRIGLVTQKGLAGVIRDNLPGVIWKRIILILIFSAIVIGNTAYEAGNISGASLGMQAVFGSVYSEYYPLILGAMAFILLFSGSYKTMERSLVFLVLVMSVSFLLTAVITQPAIMPLLKGLFVPEVNDENLFTIIALVGTTVVPYNLFLHASLVNQRWKDSSFLKISRTDTLVSVVLGGLVSLSIVIAAAAIKADRVESVMELISGLEPLYGDMARYFMGIGLFAAGITSAVTAPLAAAYVARNCFNFSGDMTSLPFRITWISVLVFGVGVQSLNLNPIALIQFAQVANGLLLPVIAVLLLWLVNKKSVLGTYSNTSLQNILTFIIICLTLFLGIRGILRAFNIW
ncbi:Nramp family divalent metal transporter [Robertkochia aurantiaca]|uniref:Nramp family divalent metal transporter n=1 Tax=Robertkochia aurantiaca TaxID=2873700 RepID=UPI001CCBE14D|nr:Nramp family divalent metal transporter [Robertkochia sp. 3YJGBD-33]